MLKGKKFQRVKVSIKEYKKLNKVENKVTSTKVLKRIQAFKFIHLEWKYNKIADFLKVNVDTITDWIRIYRTEGIDGLLTLKYKGGQQKLTMKQLSELKKEASMGTFKIAKDVQHYIKTKFSISYNLSHVQLLLKKRFTYPLRKQEKFQVILQA